MRRPAASRSGESGRAPDRVCRRRRGSTYLEVTVAFAVLGVALAGLEPLVVSQIHMIREIEKALPTDETIYIVPARHLGPAENQWLRKLGFDATITTRLTPVEAVEPPGPANLVGLTFSAVAGPGDGAWAVVAVTPIAPDPPPGEDPEGPGGEP